MSMYKILIHHFYQWNLLKFWAAIILNIIFGTISYHYSEFRFIQVMIGIGLFIFSLSFWTSTSLLPSSNTNADGFSLKYLRSLPLKKHELVFSYAIINILMALPLLSHFIAYQFYTTLPNPMEFSAKFFFASLPIIFVFGIESIHMKTMFPSNGFFESNLRKKKIISLSSKFFAGMTIMFMLLMVSRFLESFFRIEIHAYLDLFWDKIIIETISSWALGPILILFAFSYFNSTIKIWEKKDFYIKEDLNPKRDLSIIVGCFVVNFALVSHIMYRPPGYYDNDILLSAIFDKDFEKVQATIKEGVNLNKPNKYGVTPLMAAAKEGHSLVFELLKKSGATKSGVVEYPDNSQINGANLLHLALMGKNESIIKDVLDLGFDPNQTFSKYNKTAIHLAASTCQTQIIDLLLERGANIKMLNKDSQGPLHLSAKAGCYGAIMTLLDNGSDPDLKDKHGKTAFQYIKKGSKDMDYYIKKRARVPANQK